MEEPPKCHICGRPAQLRLVRSAGGLTLQLEACAVCLQSCELAEGDDLMKLFELSRDFVPFSQKTCSGCGRGWRDFFRSRRLGCGRCLEELSSPPLENFREIFFDKSAGSGMRDYVFSVSVSGFTTAEGDALSFLKSQLKRAVHREQFETAAILRDRIRELEQRPS